jgi:outer membrane protein OmpA-like peptidoglycan-associated protein
MNATSQAHRDSRLRIAVGLTGVLMLAACASTPPAPTASLQAAQLAISNAERADASRYAGGELGEARTKLASADTAVKEQRMTMAERFAEESRAEAELVLFESGRADLKTGAPGNLNKLVFFLNKHPDRSVAIEGYTDSVGSEEYNQALSQRRADSVRSYLVRQGIGSGRLTASGMGMSDPVAGNDSAAGRQQNRRVEVIVSNPPAALR